MCLKKISIVSHNASNYYYHFIIKELAELFKKQFTCFGENTEKCITFTVPIETEVTKIYKNGEWRKDYKRYIKYLYSNLF